MGIFNKEAPIFAEYNVKLVFRNMLAAGTPGDPKVIESWLRSKTGVSDEEEIQRMMVRTLIELGVPGIDLDTPYDELVRASEKVAGESKTNKFKRGVEGLYIEDRQAKAMLRESVNTLYVGEAGKWGRTKKKGPKNFFVERVFISPEKIYLGRTEPDSVELFVGHVEGPDGKRSTLTYVETVHEPEITFTVKVLRDAIPMGDWAEIWNHSQENGLGSLRSQSFGRFDITAFERVTGS